MKKLTPIQRDIVTRNIGLAQKIAHSVHRKRPDKIDLDEVLSAAYRGLVDAASKWSPDHPSIREGDIENGKAFAGYARQRILGTILDMQRGEDYVPSATRRDYKAIVAAGYPHTSQAAAAASTGLTEPHVREVIRRIESNPVQLSVYVTTEQADGEKTEDGALATDELSPEGQVIVNSISDSLLKGYDDLSEQQKLILALVYIRKMPMYKIADDVLGLTSSEVSAQHSSAVVHLLHEMQRTVTEEATEVPQIEVAAVGKELEIVLSGLPSQALSRLSYSEQEVSAWLYSRQQDTTLVVSVRRTRRGNIRYFGVVFSEEDQYATWYKDDSGDMREKFRKDFADWVNDTYDYYIQE